MARAGATAEWFVQRRCERQHPLLDWRPLREVGEALGGAWRGGLVVHAGPSVQRLDGNIWAVPVERLLV